MVEDPPDDDVPWQPMESFSSDALDQKLSDVREALGSAKEALTAADRAIEKKENDLRTLMSIGEREIEDLERRTKHAESVERWGEAHDLRERTATRQKKHTDEINQLESDLGALRGERIELAAEQSDLDAKLSSLKEQVEERAQRTAVSEDQLRRAAELEEKLGQLEAERNDLVHKIEEYAPVVEAQREVASASGSTELSEAYAKQADGYRDEWQRWLKCLGASIVLALVGGVIVILLSHPADDASPGAIASRIAIEVLVLGLLVYAVRVTAHQFRVHRHLEAVSRSKASALLTFNRLVAGPGEAEVRAAVAVALAQAVFDASSTGFIDNSQDGVTIVERFAAPVAQRLSN